MTTRDDDILDFDFFGEEEAPSWDEPPDQGSGGPPRDRPPRGRRPRFRSSGNLTPLLRLVGLIALAILIVVLLAVWVEGCASDRKTERYRDYTTEIGAIGNASARLGQQLSTTLTTPGLKLEDLDAKLGGFVQTAETQMQTAADLGSPGPLHDAQEGAVEALLFRVNGLRGLQTAFQETADATDATVAGQALAAQTGRLLASDVVWEDSFRARAQDVFESEGIEGIEVPTSVFVTAEEVTTAGRPGRHLAAHPGRVDRRHAVGTARKRDLVRQGAPERPVVVDDHGSHDPRDRRACLRGRGRGHRGQPGGPARRSR